MLFTKIKTMFKNEPTRPSRQECNSPEAREGAPQLLYPFLLSPWASSNLGGAGEYRQGYPEGAVIHYTAGKGDLNSNIAWAREKDYHYFIIGKEGQVAQALPLNRWGYHAGKSYMKGFGSGVSRYFVGIEVVCAGVLTATLKDEDTIYKTWWGESIPWSNVRCTMVGQNAQFFERFTQPQEDSLTKLLLWLHNNNPKVFSLKNVYGHYEVSPGRKIDPGFSLSSSMEEYRETLLELSRGGAPL